MSATRESVLGAINEGLTGLGGVNGYDVRILDAILDAGFEVSNADELNAWKKANEESKERLKRIARAAIQAAAHRILLVEFSTGNGGATLLVCDPDGDEHVTIERIVAAFGIAGITADRDKMRDIPGPAPAGVGS